MKCTFRDEECDKRYVNDRQCISCLLGMVVEQNKIIMKQNEQLLKKK